MTLLEFIQEFCLRQGITKPTAVMQRTDDTYLQIAALFNEILEDLLERGSWTELQRQVVFNSVAAESQGEIETLAPGCKYILNDTIWDRTRRLPVFGPKTPQGWQQIKGLPMQFPYYQYRIVQGEILITPTMPADHTMAFEYMSRFPVLAVDGTTLKAQFTVDTDTCLFPDTLLKLGIRWRWREEKGLPYGENYRMYEIAVNNAKATDGTKSDLNMSDGVNAIQPGLWIPSGNWPVSN